LNLHTAFKTCQPGPGWFSKVADAFLSALKSDFFLAKTYLADLKTDQFTTCRFEKLLALPGEEFKIGQF
jgi:hypothetical protein